VKAKDTLSMLLSVILRLQVEALGENTATCICFVEYKEKENKINQSSKRK